MPSDELESNKQINRRMSRLVKFVGKEIADLVGDMVEEKNAKLKLNGSPPQEMVTNIMAITMQFTQMLNQATLDVIQASIELDADCGMQFNKVRDKDHDDNLPWRKDFDKHD